MIFLKCRINDLPISYLLLKLQCNFLLQFLLNYKTLRFKFHRLLLQIQLQLVNKPGSFIPTFFCFQCIQGKSIQPVMAAQEAKTRKVDFEQ